MSKKKESNNKKIQVIVDHPAENEVIQSDDYTFRITPSDRVSMIELSINGGKWQTCREALGYWWFDWRAAEPGDYQAEVKVRLEDGSAVVVARRRFMCATGDRVASQES